MTINSYTERVFLVLRYISFLSSFLFFKDLFLHFYGKLQSEIERRHGRQRGVQDLAYMVGALPDDAPPSGILPMR